MKSPWMNISVLALSMSAVTTTLYAEEQKPAEVQAEQATATDQIGRASCRERVSSPV